MAFLATKTRSHMSFMCKVDVVGKTIDTIPGDHFPFFKAFGYFLNFWILFRNKLVTPHAFGHRWDPCNGRMLGIDMTTSASNLIVGHMNLVAKRDWLKDFSWRKLKG